MSLPPATETMYGLPEVGCTHSLVSAKKREVIYQQPDLVTRRDMQSRCHHLLDGKRTGALLELEQDEMRGVWYNGCMRPKERLCERVSHGAREEQKTSAEQQQQDEAICLVCYQHGRWVVVAQRGGGARICRLVDVVVCMGQSKERESPTTWTGAGFHCVVARCGQRQGVCLGHGGEGGLERYACSKAYSRNLLLGWKRRWAAGSGQKR